LKVVVARAIGGFHPPYFRSQKFFADRGGRAIFFQKSDRLLNFGGSIW
jgi:hypothetical protein